MRSRQRSKCIARLDGDMGECTFDVTMRKCSRMLVVHMSGCGRRFLSKRDSERILVVAVVVVMMGSEDMTGEGSV